MEAGQARRENTLEELLKAGREAFSLGDRRAAHELWRMAAVADPYDERVWAALMEVLTRDDDREVCLENIIAINPLNPDARRQLRAIKRTQRLNDDTPDVVNGDLSIELKRQQRAMKRAQRLKEEARATNGVIAPLNSIESIHSLAPQEEVQEPPRRRSVFRSMLVGVEIGVVAVLLGVVVSVIAYGGVIQLPLH